MRLFSALSLLIVILCLSHYRLCILKYYLTEMCERMLTFAAENIKSSPANAKRIHDVRMYHCYRDETSPNDSEANTCRLLTRDSLTIAIV